MYTQTWWYCVFPSSGYMILTLVAHWRAKFLAQPDNSSCWANVRFSLMMVLWDMMVVATGPEHRWQSVRHGMMHVTLTQQQCKLWLIPVASVGVNSWYQFCMIDTRASTPTSVAHVTSQRTISRRRQFSDDSVMRITWMNQTTWKLGRSREVFVFIAVFSCCTSIFQYNIAFLYRIYAWKCGHISWFWKCGNYMRMLI